MFVNLVFLGVIGGQDDFLRSEGQWHRWFESLSPAALPKSKTIFYTNERNSLVGIKLISKNDQFFQISRYVCKC